MSARGSAEPLVAVVGGGLAGMAAAAALSTAGCRVELFESRQGLGGRAASYVDPQTGELVDHCQHVGMGCCTSLLDFCRRVGVADCFRRDDLLTFIGPDSAAYQVRGASWLPAPLHLAPSFSRLGYLTLGDRLGIAKALWALARHPFVDHDAAPTVGSWLHARGQTDRAIARFWSVVLTSSLGEDPDRASLSAARKVFVDGFMASREAYVLHVPRVPLGAIYDRVASWLIAQQVALHLGTPVERVGWEDGPVVVYGQGRELRPDFVVLAVPWSKIASLVDPQIAGQWPWLERATRIESCPITGVHLWFDRAIMPYRHAALVGRESQWIFNRAEAATAADQGHYYQVVISASRDLAGRDRDAVVQGVRAELAEIWPVVARATLLRARVVNQPAAVFSVRPGFEQQRPAQQTALAQVMVAGDWTATGWPATMEGAVRSGYLAAEGIMRALERPQTFVAEPLARGWLARLLIRD
jgi:squalene-associated FAD-dependent desaturase